MTLTPGKAVDLPRRSPSALQGRDRRQLSVVVAEQLKEMILGGHLQSGDRIPNEAALCEHFGVSRLTVREAVQMLRSLGLLESSRGRGTFVRDPDVGALLRDLSYFAFKTPQSVADLFEVRGLLERRAVQRAANNPDEQERGELLDIVAQMKALFEAEALDRDRLAELDTAFHLRIAALSGNLVLEQLMLRVMRILEAVRVRSLNVPGQPERSWEQHLQIAEAVVRGEDELAAAHVTQHMEGVKAAIISSQSDTG